MQEMQLEVGGCIQKPQKGFGDSSMIQAEVMTERQKIELKMKILSGFVAGCRTGEGPESITLDGSTFHEGDAEGYLFELDAYLREM